MWEAWFVSFVMLALVALPRFKIRSNGRCYCLWFHSLPEWFHVWQDVWIISAVFCVMSLICNLSFARNHCLIFPFLPIKIISKSIFYLLIINVKITHRLILQIFSWLIVSYRYIYNSINTFSFKINIIQLCFITLLLLLSVLSQRNLSVSLTFLLQN